jgi:hypothetical protein
VAPAKSPCKVTRDSRLITPTRISVASTTRDVTNPIAAVRLTLVTG